MSRASRPGSTHARGRGREKPAEHVRCVPPQRAPAPTLGSAWRAAKEAKQSISQHALYTPFPHESWWCGCSTYAASSDTMVNGRNTCARAAHGAATPPTGDYAVSKSTTNTSAMPVGNGAWAHCCGSVSTGARALICTDSASSARAWPYVKTVQNRHNRISWHRIATQLLSRHCFA